MTEIKYNIGDKVRTKIHYKNDTRTEVDAIIRGIELEDETDNVKYKIWMEPEEFDKKNFGCTGATGYIDQKDIIGLCEKNVKQKELLELCKLEQSILSDGKINPDKDGYFPCEADSERVSVLYKLQEKYSYGWYIAEESLEDQIKSINKFKAYIIDLK